MKIGVADWGLNVWDEFPIKHEEALQVIKLTEAVKNISSFKQL